MDAPAESPGKAVWDAYIRTLRGRDRVERFVWQYIWVAWFVLGAAIGSIANEVIQGLACSAEQTRANTSQIGWIPPRMWQEHDECCQLDHYAWYPQSTDRPTEHRDF